MLVFVCEEDINVESSNQIMSKMHRNRYRQEYCDLNDEINHFLIYIDWLLNLN